ncbi:ABC-type transporter Mla subunit MlaD [Saonia flava]|uniref:ABC-type transporter Mla subunit MlaD n=1 Tax=Saonia flava TaxID=523696 RepID=A0A846QSX2_9FLAO|nr:hypothetical protein [Saonia flava]NJB70060.1 ABC-type transporter Mla subunit MlaD [Saonia flava]
MKNTYISYLFILFTSIAVHAQKKSELLMEIQTLKVQLDSTKALVTEARKNERVSLARAESFESQVKELQDANATLLKNLNSFAEISNKNSENINKTLASLEEKEKQLKTINDALASNDSTAIIVLTNAKQTLGENAQIGVSNGAVIVSTKKDAFFSEDTSTTVLETGIPTLEKIAAILTANPSMGLTIEGLSMTGELDLAALQASSLSTILQKQFSIAPERIIILGKDGNLKEGFNLKIHPQFGAFYLKVRESMKEGNKK